MKLFFFSNFKWLTLTIIRLKSTGQLLRLLGFDIDLLYDCLLNRKRHWPFESRQLSDSFFVGPIHRWISLHNEDKIIIKSQQQRQKKRGKKEKNQPKLHRMKNVRFLSHYPTTTVGHLNSNCVPLTTWYDRHYHHHHHFLPEASRLSQ